MPNSTANLPTYLYKLIPSSQPELIPDPHSKSENLPLSPKDITDKFIHLSTSKQVPVVVNKHFAKEKKIYIIRIKYETVKDIVRWEPSGGKGERRYEWMFRDRTSFSFRTRWYRRTAHVCTFEHGPMEKESGWWCSRLRFGMVEFGLLKIVGGEVQLDRSEWMFGGQ